MIPYAALEERSIQKYSIVMKRTSLETENYIEEFRRITNQTTRGNILSAASNFISTINEFDKPNTESSSNYDRSSMTKASV